MILQYSFSNNNVLGHLTPMETMDKIETKHVWAPFAILVKYQDKPTLHYYNSSRLFLKGIFFFFFREECKGQLHFT